MFGRFMIVMIVLAIAAVAGSIQLMPYPPEPKIKMHTFIKSDQNPNWVMSERWVDVDKK